MLSIYNLGINVRLSQFYRFEFKIIFDNFNTEYNEYVCKFRLLGSNNYIYKLLLKIHGFITIMVIFINIVFRKIKTFLSWHYEFMG